VSCHGDEAARGGCADRPGAVALADAGGFDSLSMRNLAQELDAAPMSLYRPFANKERLLDGMIDVVFSEMYSLAIGMRGRRSCTGAGWLLVRLCGAIRGRSASRRRA
jgi:hypothetical protein